MKNITFIKTHYVLFLVALFLTTNMMAQKPSSKKNFEIDLPKLEQAYVFNDNKRIDRSTGFPIAIYGIEYQSKASSPENMAKEYLLEFKKSLGLEKEEIEALNLHAVRTSLSGTIVRLRQYKYGLPVNKSEITMNINSNNQVTYVMNGLQYNVELSSVSPSISLSTAEDIAYRHVGVSGSFQYKNNKLFIYHQGKSSRLAYQINFISKDLIGEWDVFVDANSGEIFKALDISFYCNDGEKDKKKSIEKENKIECNQESVSYRFATGDGNVFDPDPLSSAMVAYGSGGITDGSDANSTALTAQTFNKTLLDLEFSGGTYQLKGPYAEVVDIESPYNGLFSQASSSFNFQRADDAFEAVSVYYHIDASMRYINTVLNLNIAPIQYTGGVRVDPHGLSGSDNSHYLSGSGSLAFGEGGVDDAEDSDVVHHELGHGIHDWVTNGNLSQVNGLSEGSGDYWAQSYNRSLGNWGSSDPAYNYVFNWDGHNEYWGGRTTDYSASYPGGLTGGVHADGQIWSTCLMKIYDIIGRAQTDKIFLEGLGMTNGSSSQDDAANAAYQAAINMGYSASELTTIHTQFTDCGYTLPALVAEPIADFSVDNSSICIDTNNTVNFTDISTGTPTSWSWTFEGGNPATSTAENPTVTYATSGTYDVTLLVTNAIGSDSEMKGNYITTLTGISCPIITCATKASPNVPLNIPITGTSGTTTSTVAISGGDVITDVNVLNLIGTHSYLGDLQATLTSPNGTVVSLFSYICGGNDDFDIQFDDAVATGSLPCPLTDGGTYQPVGNLADFNGEDPNGTWTLTFVDNAGGDSGALASWSLEVCSESTLSVAEQVEVEDFVIYPNPNRGTFNIKMNTVLEEDINLSVYDVRGRLVYDNRFVNSSNFNETVTLNNVQSGLYLVEIKTGNKAIIKKIIIE
ncbi:T9SS type A sorting domain-containing protein [Lacinutrix himadriensis]|uniref:T9SS type A sorting domain-containing protein n=1 Tax=Lacinutrix himadriensis TaxID=641549 RepID=UPI0006E3E44C|nr:T9SS type A sorting domain-containing protein [Lacinutrix himadriensis]